MFCLFVGTCECDIRINYAHCREPNRARVRVFVCCFLLILIPRLTAHPAQILIRLIGADLDAGTFGGANRLLDGLHQVLSVTDQHLGGLVILLGACGSAGKV